MSDADMAPIDSKSRRPEDLDRVAVISAIGTEHEMGYAGLQPASKTAGACSESIPSSVRSILMVEFTPDR